MFNQIYLSILSDIELVMDSVSGVFEISLSTMKAHKIL